MCVGSVGVAGWLYRVHPWYCAFCSMEKTVLHRGFCCDEKKWLCFKPKRASAVVANGIVLSSVHGNDTVVAALVLMLRGVRHLCRVKAQANYRFQLQTDAAAHALAGRWVVGAQYWRQGQWKGAVCLLVWRAVCESGL